jgi:hypothetical protein
MQANQQQFRSPCHRGNTARCASLNGVHPWLHAMPLDAAFGQVPVPYCPGGHHGRRFRKDKKKTNKTQLLPSFLIVDQHKKLTNLETRRGPSTHILSTTSPDCNPYATSQVKELSYILSYQT